MKSPHALLAASVLLASCAQDAADTSPKTIAPTISAAQKPKEAPKPYPLGTCLVTGEDLDEMDERISTVYNGQTFEFCCKPCLVKFNKNPEKYVSMLRKRR